jgi:hypothetical protein
MPMTICRSTLIAIPLVLLSGSAFAQSADQYSHRLESCFQAARLAGSICDRRADPGERLRCLESTRIVQIECLQPILPEKAAIAPNASEPVALSSRNATQPSAVIPSTAVTTGAAQGTSNQSDTVPTAPQGRLTQNQSAVVVRPADIVQPTELARQAEAINQASRPLEVTKPVEMARPVETDLLGATANANAAETKWIVSETTSPVDYSPLVSATIWPRQQVNSGLSGLTISCRAKRIKLSLRLMGDLDVPRWGEIRIDSQIGDQRPVKQPWIWDEEQGTILFYEDDPVALLQSIPDGARLRLGVGDSKGARHMATYQLFGLDAVRKKVASACAWPSSSAQASSEKR